MNSIELTVAQATVRFLAAQRTERDGEVNDLFGACFGIFGHGNLAGMGEALRGSPLRYGMARNEQSMVHIACGYARMKRGLATMACTTSVGPGATNLVTGAALATINRLPVLLLPGDTFSTRAPHPVLQQLEDAEDGNASVNDTLRPVSRYWTRVERPEQLPTALMEATHALTDPSRAGAVTVALPQDVQVQRFRYPIEFFQERVWMIERRPPDPVALRRAATLMRSARRPLIVVGGGVKRAAAEGALRELVEAVGIPIAETQSGKGALAYDHPLNLGAVGATGTAAANRIARGADLVLGVGTRWSDFTTASRTAFQHPSVRFIGLNVDPTDAAKLAALPLVADARAGLEGLLTQLGRHTTAGDYRAEAEVESRRWLELRRELLQSAGAVPLKQAAVIGAVADSFGPEAVAVCAAGSLPGELHKLWPAADSASYQVEYGYSCMGYEIPGAIGAKLAAPGRPVVAFVGDGSFLMLPSEIVTAIQERANLIIMLLDNGGFASIGSLSRALGSAGFGTLYRRRADATDADEQEGEGSGEHLPVDLAKVAEGLGAAVRRVTDAESLIEALHWARGEDGTVVIHVPVDRHDLVPGFDSWWEVPVAEISTDEAVMAARAEYERRRLDQRAYLAPAPNGEDEL